MPCRWKGSVKTRKRPEEGRERESEDGERKEAETCLPQWGKKREKDRRGKEGGREEGREREH